eukprot:CAMPEP_0113317348 /NCGR_PEP_ID=MMETSP0010_2-20120614/12289_1 /TAXON_ID=216773 ORGANISM="Corethron hystrix, Strain 308" /NCGR_SAMPLE_ID=MMETSP0010_2 /ASSEMBLY_ACC=CAM_ASM_000155 /LENGTH=437 /DNA_ID=CAMNT_0000174305 /DNA_START=6 /DNA_END=1316 /DNA_ORIENTATION=- /assembly_acc=CAM_ASM_000155
MDEHFEIPLNPNNATALIHNHLMSETETVCLGRLSMDIPDNQETDMMVTSAELSYDEDIFRHRNLSPSRNRKIQQMVPRMMQSIKKSLADLGDSSRSLGKARKSKSPKKGNLDTAEGTSTETTQPLGQSMSSDVDSMTEKNYSNDRNENYDAALFPHRVPHSPLYVYTHRSNRPVTLNDRYLLKDQIGFGAFSKVFKAVHRVSGRKFAVKRIHYPLLSEKDKQNVKSEVSILRSLNHPCIISIYEAYHTDPGYVDLVLERVLGGELYEWIAENGSFSETNARLLCQSMLRAMKYCHDCGVVHRDLKPENVLLVNKNSCDIKICDFGCAGNLNGRNAPFLSTYCGTQQYMSPEMILRRPYDAAVDMWSVGVITYMALVAYHPFDDDDQMSQQIINGSYGFERPEWTKISASAKELIAAMMAVNPLNRITAGAALFHPW